MVPSATCWNPMWPWRSIIAGMTVFPVKSTCAAPAGTCNWPRRPTRVNKLFSTRKAEFSIGALPSPVMRRAPSNTVTPAVLVWAAICQDKAAAKKNPATASKPNDVHFTRRIEASFEKSWFECDAGEPFQLSGGRPREKSKPLPFKFERVGHPERQNRFCGDDALELHDPYPSSLHKKRSC